MSVEYSPLGLPPVYFEGETSSARRVGNRIRKIRIEKGITQAELGERVGLNADRIQKYENGARKPKNELLQKIATALGVSLQALEDPDTTSYIGAMYAFFELEECFNMRVEKMPEDQPPGFCLYVDFKEDLYRYMEEWYKTYTATQVKLQAAATQEEKEFVLREYHDWEWNFPKGIADRISKELQKARLKTKIDELQEEYDRLDGKDTNDL